MTHIQEHARIKAEEEHIQAQEAARAMADAIPQPPPGFKVIRDPYAAHAEPESSSLDPGKDPYLSMDEAPQVEPDPEMEEAMSYFTSWFNSEPRPRMAQAAFEIIRDRVQR
jgi:hypothetical protein